MAKEINRTEAAALFNQLQVSVTRITPAPRKQKGDALFCGYAELQLSIMAGRTFIPFATLPGTAIKLFGTKLHFDPKSEKGEDGKYYATWFPSTIESRAVLTAQLEKDPLILKLVDEAVRSSGPHLSSQANPFVQKA
jgi:hypothetical protein